MTGHVRFAYAHEGQPLIHCLVGDSLQLTAAYRDRTFTDLSPCCYHPLVKSLDGTLVCSSCCEHLRGLLARGRRRLREAPLEEWLQPDWSPLEAPLMAAALLEKIERLFLLMDLIDDPCALATAAARESGELL